MSIITTVSTATAVQHTDVAAAAVGLRTMGVEEEYLLVDPATGRPLPLASRVVAGTAAAVSPADGVPPLDTELQQEQVESRTPPRSSLAELADDLRLLRREADARARVVGGRLAALATSPLPVAPSLTRSARYQAMGREMGLTCAEQLTCGCHVHVAVGSPEEGVAVLDRVRPWLPVLTALATSSPFWAGADTGYAGYRTQVWNRWPGTGPSDVFGSVEGYHRTVNQMLATGTLLDEGMIYFDARLSRRFPTVEIRVADVSLEVEDAVLLAGLCRALVDTSARQWRAGVGPAPVPTGVLRLAAWRASRSGLDDRLVHPEDNRLRPASAVVGALLELLRPALTAAGDLRHVEARVEHLLTHGTGARRQREAAEASGRLEDVVADAVERTTA